MEIQPINVRLLVPDEYTAWQEVIANAFGGDLRPEDQEIWKQRAEFDRYLAALEGEHMVGTGGAVTYEMTVPGGAAMTVGGVTAIATRPTHRRRGVLTAVMRRLQDIGRERGESVGILWASESTIYGRFGFGPAIEGCDVPLDRAHARLRDPRPPEGRLRQLSRDEARVVFPEAYPRLCAGIPGSLARTAADWQIYFHDSEHWRSGASSHRYVVYERGGRLPATCSTARRRTGRAASPATRSASATCRRRTGRLTGRCGASA